MPREIVDDVVRKTLQGQKREAEYWNLRKAYGSRIVNRQPSKITIEKSEYGLSEMPYFDSLERAYKAVQVPETVESCTIELCMGEGNIVTRNVTKEVFCLAKTLAYEQVSESNAYSNAMAKIFVQFMPQVLSGVSQFKFNEDRNWERITRIFFRYGVDFICEVLQQQKILWEIIDEEE